MIKYCIDKWDKNKNKLEQALREDKKLNICGYKYLLEKVVHFILNDGTGEYGFNDSKWNYEKITEIDNGDYQGTLIYLIPANCYQPGAEDYLMTYVYYGSCSGCDTLQAIQDWCSEEKFPSDKQVKDFMELCRSLICNMIKPYNNGWRNNSDFDTIEEGLDTTLKF